MNRDILSKIEQEQMISREELEELLTTTDQELIEELYRRARATAGKYYGKEIYLRGLIEFTNYCKNNCYYCGIRCGNEKAQRYRLTMDQILSCCESGWELGFRSERKNGQAIRRILTRGLTGICFDMRRQMKCIIRNFIRHRCRWHTEKSV